MLVRIIRNNQLPKLNRISFRFYSDKVEGKTQLKLNFNQY